MCDPGDSAQVEAECKINNKKLEALAEKGLGNKAYKSKDFPTAHVHYNKAIELDPHNIVFYTNRSAVLFEEGHYDECFELCKKAIDVGRKNFASFVLISKPMARMGRVHLKRKDYSLAIEQFEQSLVEHHVDSVAKELQKCKEMLLQYNDFVDEAAVEVRDSPVHGRGVFAMRDIKKLELVCFYDGEVKTKEQIVRERIDMVNKQYWMSHPTKPDSILCGYPIPQNKFGLGQLINDSKMPDIKELDFKKGIKDCEEYTLESKRLGNVSFMPDGKHFHIYATRDIKENEELFLHYGYRMWLQEFFGAMGSDEYMWKLLCWALGADVEVPTGAGLKVLRVEDAYDLSENESQFFIEKVLRMPGDKVEACKLKVPGFSFSNLLAFLLDMIKIDQVHTTILDQDICN